MGKIDKKNLISTIISLVLGFALGFVTCLLINKADNNFSKYAGTYTTETWNGGTASIVLNKDGSCKLPSDYSNMPCTYQIEDGQVYFRGDTKNKYAIGETGIVYHDHKFVKLK